MTTQSRIEFAAPVPEGHPAPVTIRVLTDRDAIVTEILGCQVVGVVNRLDDVGPAAMIPVDVNRIDDVRLAGEQR